MSFRFIDLYAGIGGFRIPLEELGGKCVFTSEWGNTPRKVYAANFSTEDHEFAGDITPYAQEPARVPAHDLLVGGFPCQPFSIAAITENLLYDRLGFDDEAQGKEFFSIARILAHHRPAAFVLENVPLLEKLYKARYFRVILKTLSHDLGYRVSWRVLSSTQWVPQRRRRLFIVGTLSTRAFDFNKVKVPWRERPVLRDIIDGKDAGHTVAKGTWEYLVERERTETHRGKNFFYAAYWPHQQAGTLIRDPCSLLLRREDQRPRHLNPRELARVMGFPEWFTPPKAYTPAYAVFGNAVAVPVVRAVAQQLVPEIRRLAGLQITPQPVAWVEQPSLPI